MYRFIYDMLCRAGRPFAGFRPGRILTWAAGRAFPPDSHVDDRDWRWFRTKYGYRLKLNPFFHIDRLILQSGQLDRQLGAHIESRVRPGDVCFDVGANIGAVSVHLARSVGQEGHVYAFEPVPAIASRLRENLAANQLSGRVSVHELALEETTGTATLRGFSSHRQNHGLGSLVIERAASDESITVPTASLNDFVSQRRIQRIDLIKLDVQGAELRLLNGGREVLQSLKPDILLEVAPSWLLAAGTNSRDLLCELELLGYRLFLPGRTGFSTPLRACDVSPQFYADNVYCTARKS